MLEEDSSSGSHSMRAIRMLLLSELRPFDLQTFTTAPSDWARLPPTHMWQSRMRTLYRKLILRKWRLMFSYDFDVLRRFNCRLPVEYLYCFEWAFYWSLSGNRTKLHREEHVRRSARCKALSHTARALVLKAQVLFRTARALVLRAQVLSRIA